MNWFKTAQQSYQRGTVSTMGDIQRYLYDAYAGRVFITRTAKKITVSLTLAHQQFGTVCYQDFWRYELNEESKAKSTFNKVSSVVGDIFADFKTNDIPNANLHAYLREGVRDIDLEHKPTSRIPSVDWAREQHGEKDWRSLIYGTRYPEVDGF